MNDMLYKHLCKVVGAENVRINEPMNLHTTFCVGGAADYFVSPDQEEQVAKISAFLKQEQVPYIVIGNGSNLLVGDGGIRGVVIELNKRFRKVNVEERVITAQAGILLSSLAMEAYKHGLTGLEFASGIPGTLGGAVYMNAGAYGGEMAQVVHCVTVLTQDGYVKTIAGDEMEFGYRTSLAETKQYVILSAELFLKQGNSEDIKKKMEELNASRREKQPLTHPSAGSTFKRPKGNFAGKLIMEAGLSGYKIGGAQVSEKHCGFVINQDHASAEDILNLIKHIQKTVNEQSGIWLEPEVKLIGEHNNTSLPYHVPNRCKV